MVAPTYATLSPVLLQGGSGQPTHGVGRRRNIIVAELNFATAVANGLTTGQTVKLATIPANTKVVIHSIWNKTTLVGTSFAVGDSTDEALYMAANSTLTINTYGTITSAGKEPGTVYSTADTLGVKLTAPTSGTIVIFYELIDLTADSIAVVP